MCKSMRYLKKGGGQCVLRGDMGLGGVMQGAADRVGSIHMLEWACPHARQCSELSQENRMRLWDLQACVG